VVVLAEESETRATAFEAVYAAEHPAVVRLAYLLVDSEAVAEELAHDAFVALFERFGEVHNPEGFLRTAVVRRAVRWRDRRDGERRRFEVVGTSASVEGVPEVDETWTAIGRLKPERATVIVLRYYSDLSHGEIAEMLGCSAGTVRSRVRRALEDLHRELDR
jgi:RNA polymerase sigma factor (sigma-70 family)